jgi:hypothetical protein
LKLYSLLYVINKNDKLKKKSILLKLRVLVY